MLAGRKAETDGCFQSGRDCSLGVGVQTGLYGTVAGIVCLAICSSVSPPSIMSTTAELLGECHPKSAGLMLIVQLRVLSVFLL